MRRFANASHIRHQLHRIFVTAMLAVAVLALLSKAAHAQACGNFSETPEAVYGQFLGASFGLADDGVHPGIPSLKGGGR